MANSEHDPSVSTNDERQYELDQITARYEEAHRAGQSPKIADYIERYPQFARELLEFALFFHTFEGDQPEPDLAPASQPSPAAQAALARIHEATPLTGIIKQGRLAGYMAPRLAETVGLGLDILSKLDAHAINGASIPQTLIRRLADVLRVTPRAVATYLERPPAAQAGAFFYADEAPRQHQESFLDAVQSSPMLSAERKREWTAITEQETGM